MKMQRVLLFLPGVLYGAVVWLRNLAYDRGWKRVEKVPLRVISIGNITVGGTGKTPMTALLLHNLAAQGIPAACLSRGYGRRTRGFLEVQPGSLPADCGDEPLLLKLRFPAVPVAVCEDRITGARELLRRYPDLQVLLLDDAFQHRRIARDLDIVLIDASRPPWEDAFLPAGSLRDSAASLRRAHLCVVTKYRSPGELEACMVRLRGQAAAAAALLPEALVPFGGGAAQPADLRGRQIIAFAGLGNNAFFEQQIRDAGAELLAFFPWPDHHPYTAAELDKILAAWRQESKKSGKFGNILLLTTEKDYCRLQGHERMPDLCTAGAHYLRAGMQWESGAAVAENMIQNCLSS